MSTTTKYLVAGSNHAEIYDVEQITKEEDGTLVIDRVNWAGKSTVRVVKSPAIRVYKLTEIDQ